MGVGGGYHWNNEGGWLLRKSLTLAIHRDQGWLKLSLNNLISKKNVFTVMIAAFFSTFSFTFISLRRTIMHCLVKMVYLKKSKC